MIEIYKRNTAFINKVILSGTVVIFFLGALFHFLYDATGKSPFAAIFFPVNESIFEHLKLVLYPSILFWIISFFILSRNHKIHFSKWIISMTFSIITSMIYIVCYYYVSHYAFDISISILDILSLLAGSFLGQLLACHLNNKLPVTKTWHIFCIIFILLICIFFANFTFYTPHLPIFMDPPTGTYGIN